MGPIHRRIAIWGAGGHGRVVAEVARLAGYGVSCFIDRDASKVGRMREGAVGLPVLAEQELLAILGASGDKGAMDYEVVALGLGDNSSRSIALDKLGNWVAPALVHPWGVVSPGSTLARGVVIMAGAVVNADAEIGAGAIINTGAIVEHDCRIGRCAHLSPGAILCGAAEIAELVWVGAGAILLPGVRVGARSIIGAGAVVLRDLPEDVVAVGNPARVIKRRG